MSNVRTIQCDSSRLKLLTGGYAVELEPAESRFSVNRADKGTDGGFLSFAPGGSDPQLLVLSGENISHTDCRESDEAIIATITGTLDWATYEVTVVLPRETPGLIVFQVAVTLTRDVDETEGLFAGEHREFACHSGNPYQMPALTYYFNGTPNSFTYHTVDSRGAMLDRNQYLFFGDHSVLAGTVFAFTDFTSLAPYYEATGTRIHGTVRQPPGCLGTPGNSYMAQPFTFGYSVPQVGKSLEAGASFLVSRNLMYIHDGSPDIGEPAKYALRFVQSVDAVYKYVQKPQPADIDWRTIVERGIQDLFTYGESEGSHATVLQQCNLNSCKRYAAAFASPEAERLVSGSEELFKAYSPKLPFGDAWQYLFPLVMAGEYAAEFGSQTAKQKFLGAAGDVVTAGRSLGYLFPQSITEDFSKKPETRFEYDCTGAYIYLMLQYHEATGDGLYIEEAKLAAEVVSGLGFEYSYEFTTTALGPLALLRLYRITGNLRHLEASYTPLAGIVRHSWLFNPGYREYRGRSIFLLTEGMPGVYANGWEEQSLLRYLDLYLAEGSDVIEPAAAHLVSELLQYKCSSLADSLAPLLPDPSIVYSGVPREWHAPVRTDFHIPMEGFGYLEWDESGLHDKPGRVSQPPYCFGALAEAALVQMRSAETGDKNRDE